MAYNKFKRVGDLCPDCGEPLVSGTKGAYCRPCYIKWAEKNKPRERKTFAEQNRKQEPDWDEISRGKVKHGFYLELFKHQLSKGDYSEAIKDRSIKTIIEKFVDEVMGTRGKDPEDIF